MTTSNYHHGSLRSALIEAAVAAAREQGPEGVALRDLARRVGVSHNAAYRHFADRDELVAEVAVRAMAELVDMMETRLAGVRTRDPVMRARRRLAESGRGYVAFAVAEPGLFRVAFTSYPEMPPEDERPARDPYALLTTTLDALVEVGFLAHANRAGAEITCWAAVHGFAVLHLDGPLRGASVRDRNDALDHVLATIDRSYAATTDTTIGPGDLKHSR